MIGMRMSVTSRSKATSGSESASSASEPSRAVVTAVAVELQAALEQRSDRLLVVDEQDVPPWSPRQVGSNRSGASDAVSITPTKGSCR